MGLDMYLTGERYLWEHNTNDRSLGVNISQLLGLPADSLVKSVTIEAGYWRKANQIHKWFVDNVQDGKDECQKEFVTREKLKELSDLCSQVIADPEKAKKLLPRESGFFFGDDSYEEWYFTDLADTIKIIDTALAMPDDWDFYYRSSW
jgi:hypothetical protein